MKRKILLALSLFLCVFAFFSCGKSDGVEVPAGMKNAGGEENGYLLFVPENWTVSNLGNVTAAYASSLDLSSVSMSVCEIPEGQSKVDYFNASVAGFSSPITEPVSKEGTLGNATDVMLFTFTVDWNAHPYKYLQAIATFGGRDYIFTYAASAENRGESEKTYYDYHLDQVVSIMENLLFTDPAGEFSRPVSGEPDADGYRPVSDPSLSGFTLYAPDGWECVLSSGIVEVRTADGADVNMTEATGTGVSVKDYWEKRKTELTGFVSELNVTRENVPLVFAGSSESVLYEYSYVFRGEKYRVYQILTVNGSFLAKKGYVFTYTAKEAVYDSYLPQVLKMGEKVTFR